MGDILRPGRGILFMKVGIHARENLEDIIERKTKEIEDAGFAFWGYGGNTCHPISMVQPFAEKHAAKGGIVLCMHKMQSMHRADPVRAEYYSADGHDWQRVPPEINVLGSRYALAIKDLRREEFSLPLAHTHVAVGNSQGKPGNKYIAGRVDKACLEIDSQSEGAPQQEESIQIGLVAELCSPYAVFLKN